MESTLNPAISICSTKILDSQSSSPELESKAADRRLLVARALTAFAAISALLGGVLLVLAHPAGGWLLAMSALTWCFVAIHSKTAADIETEHRLRLSADDLAIQANGARIRLLGTVDHEIRQPLLAIAGHAEVLASGAGETPERDRLQSIERSARGLLAMLEDIAEGGDHDDDDSVTSVIDLRELLEQAIDMNELDLASGEVEICLEVPPSSSLRVIGDHSRLRRVSINMVGAALRRLSRGSVLIRASTPQGSSGLELELSVIETGAAPPSRNHCEAYLSTIERLAGELGARFESHEVGGGRHSRFITPIEASSSPNPVTGRKLTILLVDDHADARRCQTQLLESLGHTVVAVADRQQATRALESVGFELAMIARSLGDDGAIEVALALRKLRSPRQLPLLLLGSTGERSLPGFAAALAKPLRLESSRQALDTLFADTRPVQDHLAGATRFDGMRVLVADDNEINLTVAIGLLEQLGIDAVSAHNGEETLDRCARQQFDLVLLDIQMPGLDGWETATRLRARGDCPRLVAMTADAGARNSFQDRGFDEFLAKPVRLESLRAVLEGDCCESTAGTLGPVDWSMIETLRETRDRNGRVLFDKLYLIHRDTIDERIQAIGTALDNGSSELRRLVHSLKGASSTLGACALADALAKLETAVAEDRGIGTRELDQISALAAAYGRCIESRFDIESPGADELST